MDSTSNMSLDRSLRYVTYLATAIATPLSIAATCVSLDHQTHRWARRHATAFPFAFIPLAMTVVTSFLSLRYMKKYGKSPRELHLGALDLASAFGYLGMLIPCWVLEIQEFSAGGFGLLVGYTTAPLILNMFIHFYFTLNNLPYKNLFSKLHFSTCPRRSSCQQCPNCQTKFISGTTETTTKKGYSLLRGEDYLDVEAGPIQYRDSEDFLGEGAERAEQAEQTKQPEDGGMGKGMMDV